MTCLLESQKIIQPTIQLLLVLLTEVNETFLHERISMLTTRLAFQNGRSTCCNSVINRDALHLSLVPSDQSYLTGARPTLLKCSYCLFPRANTPNLSSLNQDPLSSEPSSWKQIADLSNALLARFNHPQPLQTNAVDNSHNQIATETSVPPKFQ